MKQKMERQKAVSEQGSWGIITVRTGTGAIENTIEDLDNLKKIDTSKLTLKYRMNNVIKFISARPEGLEPSTP